MRVLVDLCVSRKAVETRTLDGQRYSVPPVLRADLSALAAYLGALARQPPPDKTTTTVTIGEFILSLTTEDTEEEAINKLQRILP